LPCASSSSAAGQRAPDRGDELREEREREERLEAEIAAKAHDPHARPAEIESEQAPTLGRAGAQRAEREDSIAATPASAARRHLPQAFQSL
jgi:hypothetical protein